MLGGSDRRWCTAILLCFEWDARWPNVGMRGHARQRQEFREQGVEAEVYYKTGAMLGLAYTPSMITLGCLDEGDERGEG